MAKAMFRIVLSTPDGLRKTVDSDEFESREQAEPILAKRGWNIEAFGPVPDPEPEAPLRPIRITTAHALSGAPHAREIGIVTAECVFGAGPLKDIAASFRNLVGGRAEGVQKLFREARDAAMADLEMNARAMGADGVVALELRYDTIETNGFVMQMAYAVGTAVALSPEGPAA